MLQSSVNLTVCLLELASALANNVNTCCKIKTTSNDNKMKYNTKVKTNAKPKA